MNPFRRFQLWMHKKLDGNLPELQTQVDNSIKGLERVKAAIEARNKADEEILQGLEKIIKANQEEPS